MYLTDADKNLAMFVFLGLFFLLLGSPTSAVELTFELPDNAKECFHEDIEKGTETTLEFQVRINLCFNIYN